MDRKSLIQLSKRILIKGERGARTMSFRFFFVRRGEKEKRRKEILDGRTRLVGCRAFLLKLVSVLRKRGVVFRQSVERYRTVHP